MGMLKLFRRKRGQALVEMALVLPILLLLVFGIVEFGRIYHCHMTLTSATREGARAGSVGAKTEVVEQTVKDNLFGLNEEKVSITIDSGSRGNPYEVEAVYSLEIITPVISLIIGENYEVKGSTTMRVE